MAISRILRNLPEDAAWAGQSNESGNRPVLAKRPFGRTAEKLSIIGLGGLVVAGLDRKQADATVAKCIEKGVNYFDVAPTYGDAEEKLGPALQPYRKNVFLACKTQQRGYSEAATELKTSLKRLRTDHLDLYQLHALTDVKKDVDTAFARGGAMEAFIEAKKAGLVRYLGFSAHSVDAALAAMDRYDFDSILFPVNFACYYGGNFGRQVIKKAKSKRMAVLAIKSLAYRYWQTQDGPEREKFNRCWYKPLSNREDAELGLRFALSQSITAAIPPGEEKMFWLAVDIAMDFKPLNLKETKRVEDWGTRTVPMFKYQKED